MMKRRQIISIVLVSLSVCFAFEGKIPSSHRSVLQQLAHMIITTAVEEENLFSSSAVFLRMEDLPVHSVVRNDIVGALLSRNITVQTAQESAGTIMTCTVQDPAVSYGDMFTESIFGARKVERIVSLTMHVDVASRLNNTIVFSKKYSVSNIDTVLYDDIQNLEDPTLPVRSMSRPHPSFFDSFLEPVLVTVASAVAIYLFFTIRS